jgi:hypothetical protein
MGGLGLVPNEIVGWRLKPDFYNVTVTVVKRYGPASKKAGQEYEEPLAYCRNVKGAVEWLIQHVTRVKGEQLQDVTQAATKSVADATALMQAVEAAREAALAAVDDLEARLRARGLVGNKALTHFLGGTAPRDEHAESAPEVLSTEARE